MRCASSRAAIGRRIRVLCLDVEAYKERAQQTRAYWSTVRQSHHPCVPRTFCLVLAIANPMRRRSSRRKCGLFGQRTACTIQGGLRVPFCLSSQHYHLCSRARVLNRSTRFVNAQKCMGLVGQQSLRRGPSVSHLCSGEGAWGSCGRACRWQSTKGAHHCRRSKRSLSVQPRRSAQLGLSLTASPTALTLFSRRQRRVLLARPGHAAGDDDRLDAKHDRRRVKRQTRCAAARAGTSCSSA